MTSLSEKPPDAIHKCYEINKKHLLVALQKQDTGKIAMYAHIVRSMEARYGFTNRQTRSQ